MRCEAARPLLLRGTDAGAEAHLEACDHCFSWLEAHDPMVGMLKAAVPAVSPVPAGVGASILQRWQPHHVSFRLGIAAAAALALLALILSGVAVVSAPALTASLVASSGNVAATLTGAMVGLLAVPRALLLDQPAVLALFLIATIAVCALWGRLYQNTQLPRRVAS